MTGGWSDLVGSSMVTVPRVVFLVALACMIAAAGGRPSAALAVGDVPPVHPNVLVFVSDDQSRRTVTRAVMPTVYRVMVAGGRTYPGFTVTDPLCCPSRASIMTGRFNHNNRVLSNDTRTPLNIDIRSTIQCYLHDAGYATALYGKFLNHFPLSFDQPCLSDYAINPGQRHSEVDVSVNGTIVRPPGWIDEFDLDRASRFLDRGERRDRRPWYLYFSDSYPHSPYVPRPEHANDVIAPPPGTIGPAVGEADVSDKPIFVQQNGGATRTNQTIENELRMLRTVDEHFAALIARLRADGELPYTLIVYISDNGYLFGEHDLWGKSTPYSEAINVPFMLRWPGHVPAGTGARRNAQNIDIAPTIVHAAGISPALRYPYDGRSLLRRWSRPTIFTESFHPKWEVSRARWQPSWRSIRTRAYQYVEWRQGTLITREYYDLRSDPHQLVNLLGNGTHADDPQHLRALHALVVDYAHCAGRTCR